MNFCNLNQDVLLKIVEYLSLDDQISLWQANEPTSQLNMVLCHAWQRSKKHDLCGNCFQGQPKAVLDAFLDAVSGTLEQLTLNEVPMEQLDVWHKYSFPKMQALLYKEYEDGRIDEAEIKILAECFPLLKTVKLKCRRISPHLSSWKNLNHLDLRECWNVTADCMERVFENLRLRVLKIGQYEEPFPSMEKSMQELEELELGILKEKIRGLNTLPKLKKLSYNAFLSDHWLSVTNIGKRRILAETTNVMTFYLLSMCTRWMSFHKAIKLTLVGAAHGLITPFHTYKHFKPFCHLRQLHVHNVDLWRNADQLWEMVSDCPKLEILIISKQGLSSFFVRFNLETMHQVLRVRSEPLHLVFHQVNCTNLIIKYFRHPKLKVSFQAVDCTHFREHILELMLLPLEHD
ncbi:uncharacterized protein LOC117584211 [Drosophila guanche]|uniref:F-box domain-containing protein n=1 Tax=Drosophila guanche TaxID=7266 RepID=A0A3B0K667_DROGU|nr:uncharacterized protein LOC117584211 [Drosophila guanche]SPP81499.1 Hypothetical predicted protein [Drosophila guanche]